MINTRFEAYKVKRELKRSGKIFEFYRKANNEFGEPTGENILVGTMLGLLHLYKPTQYIKIHLSNDVQVRDKEEIMILCCKEDADKLNLQVGDLVKINGSWCKFNKAIDIQDWGIISDISVEEIDNG